MEAVEWSKRLNWDGEGQGALHVCRRPKQSW